MIHKGRRSYVFSFLLASRLRKTIFKLLDIDHFTQEQAKISVIINSERSEIWYENNQHSNNG